MASVGLPKGNNERVAWSINFEAEFPTLSESLGFSEDEKKELLDHVANLRYAILRSQKALAFSKACSKYKSEMLGGIKDTQEAPVSPVFNDIAPPAVPVEAGIVPFIKTALQRMKLNKNFSEAIAQTLMIAETEAEAVSLEDSKPTGQGSARANSVVRIEWFKGIFDGVIVESQRGDETVWTRLDRDFRSPFDDDRPPLVAGKPEERRYRLRYFIDDELVGEYSDIIVVITKP